MVVATHGVEGLSLTQKARDRCKESVNLSPLAASADLQGSSHIHATELFFSILGSFWLARQLVNAYVGDLGFG